METEHIEKKETATTRWIEDGVAGGFTYRCLPGDGMECKYDSCNSEWAVFTRKDNHSSICPTIEELVLRPDFWQAVGKTRGWSFPVVTYRRYSTPNSEVSMENTNRYVNEMHRFIDALADGKDINTALEGIE